MATPNDPNIGISITGDYEAGTAFTAAQRDIKQLDSAAGRAGSGARTMNAAWAAAGPVLLAAGGAAATLANQMVNAASDAAESSAKFGVVFAGQAEAVNEQLEEMAGRINRSTIEMRGFAGMLGDTFKPLGFTLDRAAELSVQMVALGEDLAAFNNLNTADVMRDIQAATTGETEVLKKYGIIANQARIEQEALNAGLWDGVGAIDAQAKAQAIMNIMIAGSADAIGAAEREADGYASLLRSLEASSLDLQVAVGERLTPAFEFFVRQLTKAAEAAELIVTWNSRITATYEENSAAITASASGYEEYTRNQLALAEAAGKTVVTYERFQEFAALGLEHQLADAIVLMSEAEFTNYQTRQRLIDQYADYEHIYDDDQVEAYSISVEEAARREKEATEAAAALAEARLQSFETLLALSEHTGNYASQQSDLAAEITAAKAELAELEGSDWYPGLADDIDEAKTKVDELTATYWDNQQAHLEATQQIIFNNELARMSVDGLTAAEAEAAMALAESFGMVNDAGLKMAIGLSRAEDILDGEGVIAYTNYVDNLGRAIAGLPPRWNITIAVGTELSGEASRFLDDALAADEEERRERDASYTTVNPTNDSQGINSGGSYGFASGGEFVVPGTGAGDRPYLIGLTPGEHVQITPAGERFRGGSGMVVEQMVINFNDTPATGSAIDAAAVAAQIRAAMEDV